MIHTLRIEFDGVLYYVTSRGNAREHIFITDTNRVLLLAKKTSFNSKIKDPFYSSYEIRFHIHWIRYCTGKLWGSGCNPEPAVGMQNKLLYSFRFKSIFFVEFITVSKLKRSQKN